MPINYTMPTNVSSLTGLGDYANLVTGQVFGIGILLVVMILFFTSLNRVYGLRTSLGSSAVLLGVMSILWRFAGMISDNTMFFCIMIGVGSILYLLFTKE